MKKHLALFCAALSGLMLLLALLYAVVAVVSLRRDAYPQEPPFDAMAIELVDYLKGDLAALSPELFTEREQLHMVDVLALFAGGRSLAKLCFSGALPLFFLALWLGGRIRSGDGLLVGFGLFAGFALFLAVWAALDFDGWFIALHRLAFTNDLWLLDPANSMLIRMLPTAFFMKIIGRIGLFFAGGTALLVAIALTLRHPYGRKHVS